MQGGGDAECVPGAIGEIPETPHLHRVCRRHSGERRRHANGPAIGFQEEDAIRPQAGVGCSNIVLGAGTSRGDVGQRGCLRRAREVLIECLPDAAIEIVIGRCRGSQSGLLSVFHVESMEDVMDDWRNE